MNEEMQKKFKDIIESNFAKSESEVLVRLISDHESLKAKSAEQETRIKELSKHVEILREELKVAEGAKQALREEATSLRAREKEAVEAHDKMKKEFVALEVKYLRESKDEIFKLTEIAFRNPTKLRKFDMPVVDESSNTSNGYSNSYKTNKTIPITEEISEI